MTGLVGATLGLDGATPAPVGVTSALGGATSGPVSAPVVLLAGAGSDRVRVASVPAALLVSNSAAGWVLASVLRSARAWDLALESVVELVWALRSMPA
ncbi:hypothetical protein AWC11_02555 [Mycobacterium interjectum]|nr:hypothetical protein AWC11_02555 [Mycobacterium interjectum]